MTSLFLALLLEKGMVWLKNCFFSESVGWAYQSIFFFFFFEGKIKLANELQSFSRQWPLYVCY